MSKIVLDIDFLQSLVSKFKVRLSAVWNQKDVDWNWFQVAFVILLRRFSLTDEKAFWSAFEKKVMKKRSEKAGR